MLHIIDSINEWVGKVTSFIVLFVIAVITWEVILRYVFNQPTVWAHEIGQHLFGVYYILAAGYVHLHKGHVNMDLFYNRFSPRMRSIIDLTIVSVLFFSFFGILLWQGGLMAWRSYHVGETTGTVFNLAVYPFKLLVPIGAFLVLLQGLNKFIRDVMSLSEQDPT